MKKLLVIVLTLIMAFAAGCILGGDDDKKDSESGGDGSGSSGSAASYLPFKEGAKWEFSTSDTYYWEGSSNSDTSTFTTICTGTTTLNGKTYWVLKDVDDDGYEDEYYLRVSGDDVYLYGTMETYKAALTEKESDIGISAIKKSLAAADDEEWLMFRFKKSAGTSWTVYSDSSTDEEYTYSTSITGIFYGLENVITPAGTFSNCARFDFNYASSYTHSGETFEHNWTTSMWFAPDVGPVKDSETYKEGDVTVEYSESLCTSYDLSGSVVGD